MVYVTVCKNQTPEICLEAIRQNGHALRYIKTSTTPEICLEAVRKNGCALRYIRAPAPEICLEAVRQNGYALQYVISQTPEICLEAVRQNGDALQYVLSQTPEICLEAVRENENALEYVISIDFNLLAYLMQNKSIDFIKCLIIDKQINMSVFMNALLISSDEVRLTYDEYISLK